MTMRFRGYRVGVLTAYLDGVDSNLLTVTIE